MASTTLSARAADEVSSAADPGTMPARATRKLAAHAAELHYDAVPAPLVELIKQCVLDTLGVAIGASTLAPEAELVRDYVVDLGGKPESTLLGFGGKAPAPWATFVNGSLGHMLDYDDVGDGGHVSIATIPVAFAMAEKQGNVNGRDFLAAVAAGTDLHTRLDLSIDIPDWTMTEGWFATQLFGFLSGAATAGSLLRLDASKMENALGIGFNQIERQPADGSRRRDTHALDAGRLLRSSCGHGGRACAPRHDRLQRGDRRPLRPFQELRPHRHAALGCTVGRARLGLSAAQNARVQGVAGVRLYTSYQYRHARAASETRPQTGRSRDHHDHRRHRRHAPAVRAAREQAQARRRASMANTAFLSRRP